MAYPIGSLRFTVEFDGDNSAWTQTELATLAQAIYDAATGDAGVIAALNGAGGDYTLPRIVFVPGVDGINASHIGGNSRKVEAS
jgi:hypothetical protein